MTNASTNSNPDPELDYHNHTLDVLMLGTASEQNNLYLVPRGVVPTLLVITAAYIVFLTALAIALTLVTQQLRSVALQLRPPHQPRFRIQKACLKKEPSPPTPPPKPDSELDDDEDECRI